VQFHHVWAAYHKKLNAKPLSFYLKNVEVWPLTHQHDAASAARPVLPL